MHALLGAIEIPQLRSLCLDYYVEPAEIIAAASGKFHALPEDLQTRVRASADKVLTLDLRNCETLAEADLLVLGREFRQLRRLDLRGCKALEIDAWAGFQLVDVDDETIGHKSFHLIFRAFKLHASLVVQVTNTQEFLFTHGEEHSQGTIHYVRQDRKATYTASCDRPAEVTEATLQPYRLPKDAADFRAYSEIRKQPDEEKKAGDLARTLSLHRN